MQIPDNTPDGPGTITLTPVFNQEGIQDYMARHDCKTADEASAYFKGYAEALQSLGADREALTDALGAYDDAPSGRQAQRIYAAADRLSDAIDAAHSKASTDFMRSFFG